MASRVDTLSPLLRAAMIIGGRCGSSPPPSSWQTSPLSFPESSSAITTSSERHRACTPGTLQTHAWSWISVASTDIQTFKFRILLVAQVRLDLSVGCALASVNLEDTYWHVPNPHDFNLCYGIDNISVPRFTFGLKVAPKLLQPVRKRLPRVKVQVLMYLDDWLIISDSIENCNHMVNRTFAISQSMGFLFNLRKSYFSLSLSLTLLDLQ